MVLAYKPKTLSTKSDKVVEKIKRIPFIYSYFNNGGGVLTDDYKTTANIILTGVVLNLQSDATGARYAAVDCTINGVKIIGQGIRSSLTQSNALALMVNIPNWNLSADSLLKSTTNCTADGYATITWIGYFE